MRNFLKKSDNRKLFAAIRWAIALIVILAYLVYLYNHRQSLTALLSVSWFPLGQLFAGIWLTWFVIHLQSLLLIRSLGVPIGLWENFWLGMVSVIGNYLPLRAGTVMRIAYFKQRYNLSLSEFGGAFAFRTLIMLWVHGLIGLVAMGFFADWNHHELWLALFYLLLTVLPPLLALMGEGHHFLKGRIPHVALLLRTVAEYRKKKLLLLQMVALTLAQYLLLAWRIDVSQSISGSEAPFFVLILAAPMTAIASHLALTPGGLGLREGLMGLLFEATGYTFTAGVILGTVDRAAILILIIPFGIMGLWVIQRRLKKHHLLNKPHP